MIANDRVMAAAITEMWEDIGVKVVLDVIDIEARHRKNRQQTSRVSGGRIPPRSSATRTA
jgi:hypothetical protein